MSVVTDAVLVCGLAGAGDVDTEEIAADLRGTTDPALNFHAADHLTKGGKTFQAHCMVGAFNFVAPEVVVAELRVWDGWQRWEIDWAQVLLQAENNEGFTLVTVFSDDWDPTVVEDDSE